MIAHDGHPFTGRVVHVRVKKLGITRDGYVIGRVIRTIDVGRPDPIACTYHGPAIVNDPPWEGTRLRLSSVQTQAQLQKKVVTHLTRFGATTAKEIAAAIHESWARVGDHLSGREGAVYCRVGREGTAMTWGLVGVDSK